jgi:hypothetical protein
VDKVVRTAGEAMLTTPYDIRCPSPSVRYRDFFRDDHVHAALIVSPAGYLESVVERDDIAGWQAPDAAAAPLGRLTGRTVPAGASLADVRQAMTATGRRRVAVHQRRRPASRPAVPEGQPDGILLRPGRRARALGEADPAAVGRTAIG